MATEIGTVTPYKKGSPPDFGTLYSGRALEFDGVSDYVSVANTLDFRAAGNIPIYTISFWINPTAIANNDKGIMSVGNTTTDGSASWVIQRDAGVIKWINQSYTHTIGTMVAGQWSYVVITYDGTDTKTYFDGVLASTRTETPAHSGNFDYLYMGVGNDGYFDGNLSNVQIWDKAWTLEDVQYAYTHPEKLITHNSAVTSGTTISNLKAWYPMTEGNPDSPQVTVYDGSPKELGSEIFTDGDMELSGITNWDDNNDGSEATITKDTSNPYAGSNSLKTLREDGDGGFAQQVTLEDGAVYKYTGNVYVSASTWNPAWDSTDNVGAGSLGTSISITGQWVSFTEYFTATSTTMYVGGWKSIDDTYVLLDNLSLKKVQMGNHATTTFTEIIEEDDASSDNTSNWTAVGTSATKLHDTDHYDHGNDGINSYFYNTFSGTSGAQYEVVFKIVNNNATADFDVNATYYNGSSYTEGTTKTIDSASVSYTTVRHTFTADATSGSSRWGLRVQSNLGRTKVSIKDLSITQIGVASGWTTADAEPLIPQTALMGMSKPMVFDGEDDKIDIGSSGTNLGTADWSFSWWMKTGTSIADKRIFGSSAGEWSIQGETTAKIRLNCDDLNVTSDALPGSGIVNDDKLHHYVMTMDRDTDGSDGYSAKFYRDGSLWSTITGSDGHDLDEPLRFLGANHTISAFSELDVFTEISQWNSVLTLAQVQELFNDGVALDALEVGTPTGYWRNNVLHTDGKWKDLSTNSNHGTIIGSPDTILLPEGTTSGKDILGFPLTHTNNGWLNLDNTGTQPLSISKSSVFEIGTGDCTLECWVKLDWSTVSEMWNLVQLSGSGRVYMAWRGDSSDYIQFNIQVASGGNQDYSPFTIVDTNWHHIVGVFDRSASTPKIYAYKDGGTLGGGTTASTNITVGSSVITISNDPKIGDSDFSGSLDEVRIYKKALSAAEVLKNYKHGKGKHKN